MYMYQLDGLLDWIGVFTHPREVNGNSGEDRGRGVGIQKQKHFKGSMKLIKIRIFSFRKFSQDVLHIFPGNIYINNKAIL